MNLTFRSMNPGEGPELKKLAQKSFGLIEGLFVTKPKTAIVAILDEKIVGGFVYQVETIGDKKIGFASFLFIDPTFQGQGIGKRLIEEGLQRLWEEGCDVLVTFVRDDNIASWGAFEKNGFVLASLSRLARLVGWPGVAKLCVKTIYGFSVGHDFYVSLRDEKSTDLYRHKKEESAGQIAAYVIINILLSLPIVLAAGNMFYAMVSTAFFFLGMVLMGYLGTLFSKRKWNFRFIGGGMPVYFIISLATRGFFPLIGNWYPSRYENTPEFKRDMAINAIVVWLFLLGLAAVGKIAGDSLQVVSEIVSLLLFFRCLPVPTFESLGFGRVFRWNKIVLGLLVAASITLVFVL